MRRLKKNQAVFITLISALFTVGVIFLLFGSDSKTNQSNLDFIRSFGWEVQEKPKQISHITIPKEFNPVFEAYIALENGAGFSLSDHHGERATRYSYQVTNHKESGTDLIRANVYVTKSGIIAGDICSLAPNGFIRAISDTTDIIE